MKKGKVLAKLGCVFLFLALLLALMPTTALAVTPPMALDGYVTINGVRAVDGTPVEARVNGAVVATGATYTDAGGAGAYVLVITEAYEGEDIYVFVYGIEGTDSPIDWPMEWYSGTRHKDVSITKAHLVTAIVSPTEGDTFSTEQQFTVTATVTNTGQEDATDVTATIDVTGGAELAVGETAAQNIGPLAVGVISADITWTLVCTSSDAVTITVTPAGQTPDNTDAGGFVPIPEVNLEADSVTVNQELKAHLVADISSPAEGDTFSTEQEFTVTATVTNTGEADALDVTATIAVTGGAELVGPGPPGTVTIGGIAGGATSSSVSWTLVCNSTDAVSITVTPAGTDENTGEAVLEANIEADSVTVNQELKAHLVADISSPAEGDTFSTEQEFTVTATVANTGEADALDVTATIDVTGGAELAVGETAAQTIGAIAGGATSSSVTWTLVCNSSDAVTITVTPDGTDENTGEAVLEANIEADSVTVNQELKAHLVASISSPAEGDTFSTEQEFTVTATVTNTGEADALDVIGTIDIDGPAELQAGETPEKVVEADVNGHLDGIGGWGACTTGSLSWTLVCTGSGEVTITVTPNGTDENTGEPVLEANIESDTVTFEQEEVAAEVLINEFVSDPGEGQNELIELYNPGGTTVALTGWTIEDGTASPASLDGKTIAANEYLVLEQGIDFTFALDNSGDIVILRNDTAEVDRVAYGNYDDGNTTDNAPAPGDGESTGRCPNGSDTDVDSVDFTVTVTPTLGEENACPVYYTLTMAVNGDGTTTPAVGDHTYLMGEVVEITANPDPGRQFNNWTGDVANPDSDSTTVTMNADKTVTANFSIIPEAIIYDIPLALGWNYISLPLIPEDDGIEAVLDSVEGKYEDTWAYEAASETWRTYKPGAPPEYYAGLAALGIEELQSMVDGFGYMINMTEANELSGSGLEQRVGPYMPPTYSVYQGWNLVGFKTMDFNDDDVITQADDSMTVGYYLLTMDQDVDDQVVGDEVTYLRYYQPADGQFHELSDADIMLVGYGYWLYARVSGEIVPPIEPEG